MTEYKHLFAPVTMVLFMGLFICLILSIAWIPEYLATAAFGGLTWGQALVFALHIPPVIAAWLYIFLGPEPDQ